MFVILCNIITCSTLHYSYYSKPKEYAFDEKKSILSYEHGANYYLASTKSVFQYESNNLTVAVQVHNIQNKLISVGAFCLPLIPCFGYNNESYRSRYKYVDIVIGFSSKQDNEPIIFNPCDVIIEINDKRKEKPELYANVMSLSNAISYDLHLKSTRYPFEKLQMNKCGVGFNSILRLENNTAYVVRYMFNLQSDNKIIVNLPKISYNKQVIEIPKIEFTEASEFSYMPMFM